MQYARIRQDDINRKFRTKHVGAKLEVCCGAIPLQLSLEHDTAPPNLGEHPLFG